MVKRKFSRTLLACCRERSSRGKSRNPLRWLMAGECGALWAPQSSILRLRLSVVLLQQRRPGRIGRVARRLQQLPRAAGPPRGTERRAGIPTGIAEEHDHASVRRPGRSFVVIAVGEATGVAAVGFHDADGKPALRLFGEGD